MAETAVGFVVEYLTPLLIEEAKLLRNVRSEILDIRDELQSIKCFLKDADMKAETEDDSVRDGVKEWVKQITKVSFRIEDVIDEYIFHLATHRHRGGFIGSLCRFGHCLIKLTPRHQIASQIQDIKVKVRQIKERRERYGFDPSIIQQDGSTTTTSAAASWYDPRKEALYLEEAEVVGIDSPRDELIGWLLDKRQTHRTAISVVGMGGSGKTTLAKKVYDSVKQKFDCHGWVTVSQSYQKVELLKDIIKKFCEGNKEPAPEGINAMDEETLTNKLREYLLQKRYVVIFDDVWKVDFWGDIEHALLDNKNGGRVVITTRNMEVANFCRISSLVHVRRLKPLPHDKAWQLFCNKVFKFDFEGRCPTYLAELSHKIVHKCEGLPLAIVAIAGLLSTKNKTIHEWQKLHDSLSSELESNPQLASIRKILSLSYSDLPHHLKSCFLYFGMYPEDYSIRCSRLIRQWIAEGFVNQKKDKTLEEVALEYLAELIHRSLVQVSKVDSRGRLRNCRIHDLLREVVVKKMESSFCHVVDGNESTLKGEIVTRRLSIVNNSCSTVLQDAD
ncbi:disease resistance protein RPM1-like [Ziziphus jujuba]|uniref:Disease resistance protein RPM1-like n=1 Tax=Ziziphus jujuba TaxID=326968 RepID=A0ABM3I812_ZIZJJ|nr:disease resistance protein RPM1-like [Ziziphus jujuba]